MWEKIVSAGGGGRGKWQLPVRGRVWWVRYVNKGGQLHSNLCNYYKTITLFADCQFLT